MHLACKLEVTRAIESVVVNSLAQWGNCPLFTARCSLDRSLALLTPRSKTHPQGPWNPKPISTAQ